MADAQHDDIDQQAIRAARETLATCAIRLDRYRAALDSGTDPTIVSRWIADVQAEQVTAEATLRRLTGRRTMTPDEIQHMEKALGDMAAVLREADPADKTLIYRELGLTLTYRPTARTVSAQANPNGSCSKTVSEGGLEPPRPIRALAPQASASAIPPPGPALSSLPCRPRWSTIRRPPSGPHGELLYTPQMDHAHRHPPPAQAGQTGARDACVPGPRVG